MTDLRLGSLTVEDTGSGPTIVMIHGLGGSSNSFQTLMPNLRHYRVLRLDLPGAGRSALSPGRTGIEGLVRSVRDALRLADVKHAHLVGHSMGTLVCQHLAAAYPDTVRSLTLFGALLEPPLQARAALKERAAEARHNGMTAIADGVAAASIGETTKVSNPVAVAFVRESLMRQDPRGYAEHCDALSEAKAANHDAIRCPTLLVAGTEDPVAPIGMGRELANRLPNARLEALPKVAHWMMLESPQCCSDLLLEHIEAIEQPEKS